MDNENIENIEKIETKLVRKRKLKIKPLIIIIMIVLGIVMIASLLFTYFRFINDPTKIFTKTINSVYDEFHNNLDLLIETERSYFNFDDYSESIEADIKVDGSFMNFKDLKNNTFKVTYGADIKNDLVFYGAKVLEDDKDILNGTIYLKGTSGYLESNTFFDNIYSVETGENIFELIDFDQLKENYNTNTYSAEDFDNTILEIKNALIESLDKNNMKNTQEKLEINDETIKVNKVSYQFTKESTKKFLSSISDILLSKDDVITNISKIIVIDKEELIKTLKDFKEDAFYDDFTNEDNFEIAIYTTGFTYRFVKLELIHQDFKFEVSKFKDNTKVTFSDFKNTGVYEINCKIKNEIPTILVTYNKEQIAKYVIKENDKNKIHIEYELNDNGEKQKGYLKLQLDSNTETEAIGSVELYTDISTSSESYDLKVNADFKILVGTSIEAKKLDNAISMNDMKDEDVKKFEQALKDMEETNFYKYILNMLGLNGNDFLPNMTM